MAGPGGTQGILWERLRRLFPPHAVASTSAAGSLAITWALEDAPARCATPILVRFEPRWLRSFEAATADARSTLADSADDVVRAGMLGYQPDTRVPQMRVIVVG
jgi:hypothetical protein